MRHERSTRRRTFLKTIASLVAAAATASSAVGARDDEPSKRCDGPPRGVGIGLEALSRHPDRYLATVDRLVGRYVVLLLEDDGELVDQLVVSTDELPGVEEGDVLVVTVEDGDLGRAWRLPGVTRQRRRRARERFECLADRPS